MAKFPKALEHRSSFRNESDFQNYWVARVRHLGFIVHVNSKAKRGTRQERALADTFVRHRNGFLRGYWIAIESKYPIGKWDYSSVEQQEAAICGDIEVADCWERICEILGIQIEEQERF